MTGWITSFLTKSKINHYEQFENLRDLVGETRLRTLGGDQGGTAQRRICCSDANTY